MELKEVQTWEKYDAMLTIEKRTYQVVLARIYECDDDKLKALYRKQLKLSKEMIKCLKPIIAELKELAAFRNMKRLNKHTKAFEQHMKTKLRVEREINAHLMPKMDEFNEMIDGEGVVEDLGLVPVTPTDNDEFMEV